MIQYLALVYTIIATAAGQILMKKGMMSFSVRPATANIILQMLKLMVTNPYIFLGLLMAVTSTVSWMMTLSRLELSFAYPFLSLAFPLVLIFSFIILGEKSSIMQCLGIFVIFIGLVIISKG